jgi:DNA polymerase III delta prime subunit
VRYCKTAEIDTRPMDSLVMPKERKTLIEALVRKFSSNDPASSRLSWRADHMENKGEGQIFLLHGPPGVGKTFTAGE